MPAYNLIEYSDNYSKTVAGLWQWYRDQPDKDDITYSKFFKFKTKMTESTAGDGNTNDVEVVVSLKHLSSFWLILKMLLINCEVNLIVIFSVNCVIYSATGAATFK